MPLGPILQDGCIRRVVACGSAPSPGSQASRGGIVSRTSGPTGIPLRPAQRWSEADGKTVLFDGRDLQEARQVRSREVLSLVDSNRLDKFVDGDKLIFKVDQSTCWPKAMMNCPGLPTTRASASKKSPPSGLPAMPRSRRASASSMPTRSRRPTRPPRPRSPTPPVSGWRHPPTRLLRGAGCWI